MKRLYYSKGFILALLSMLIFIEQGGATDRYVNKDGTCGGAIPCYSTIQDAINAAVAGDNIYVQAGIYKEDVTINKSVHLIGAGAATTIIKPGTSNIGTVSGAGAEAGSSASVIKTLANNITISGLTIDGSNEDISGVERSVNGVTIDARNGIISYVSGSENYNNLVLENLVIKNLYGRGVALSTSSIRGSNAIRNCTFDNIEGNDYSIGVFCYWTGMLVDNCSFNKSYVSINQSISFTFTNNTCTNKYGGVTVSNASNVIIENNTIDCRAPISYGIWVYQTGGALLRNNNIRNSSYGIVIEGSYNASTVTLTNNTIDGAFGGYTDPTPVVGVYATTEVSYYNPGGALTINFTGGNHISHVARGIVLQASNAIRDYIEGPITGTGPAGSYTMNATINDVTFVNVSTNYIELDKQGAVSHIPNITPTNIHFDALNTSSVADGFAIEDKIYHRMDDAALSSVRTEGLIDFAANKVFVTRNGTNTSAQRGFDVAPAGWSVYLKSGPAFAEDVIITEPRSVGSDGSTSVRSLTMNGVGATLTLLNDLDVDNALTLINGNIQTGANSLNLKPTAIVTGASDASHVNGTVTKQGGSAFVFPVGNGSLHRPLSISGSGTATDIFKASYTAASAQALSSVISVAGTPAMIAVSEKEYWNLEQISGSSSVDVGINWRSEAISGTKASDAHLTLAARSSGGWSNLGGIASESGGLVWVTAPSSSGAIIYALGSNNGATALPLYFISFNTRSKGEKVLLEWQVGDNEDGTFFIEKSSNGSHYVSIAAIASGAPINNNSVYSYSDDKSSDGKTYYRIKWTNGQRTVYSTTRVVLSNVKVVSDLIYYKNGRILLELDSKWEGGMLTTFSAKGNKVYEEKIHGNTKAIPVNSWSKGLYIVQLHSHADNNLKSFKILVR